MELVAGGDGGGCLLVQQGHDLVHQGQLLLLSLSLGQCRQGDLAELAEVAGQALGGFGGVERLEGVHAFRCAGEGLMNRSTEWMVVEAGR